MLYDNRPKKNGEYEVIPLTPSLRALAYVLRHKEDWPEGFEWNYRYPSNCAMGLATQLWPDHVLAPSTLCMSETFNMPRRKAMDIFLQGERIYNILWKVSPEQIARQIEKYLAKA